MVISPGIDGIDGIDGCGPPLVQEIKLSLQEAERDIFGYGVARTPCESRWFHLQSSSL